jgi:hypothetical protein
MFYQKILTVLPGKRMQEENHVRKELVMRALRRREPCKEESLVEGALLIRKPCRGGTILERESYRGGDPITLLRNKSCGRQNPVED